MDKKEKIEFFIGLVQQWQQYTFSLFMNRHAQNETAKNHGQEAEQEKKRLKEEEMSLSKILEILDAPFIAFFGKSIEQLYEFSDDPEQFKIKEKSESPNVEPDLTYDEFVEAFELSLRTSRESISNDPDMSK